MIITIKKPLHFLDMEELIKAGIDKVYVLEICLLFYFGNKKHGHKNIVKLLTLMYVFKWVVIMSIIYYKMLSRTRITLCP